MSEQERKDNLKYAICYIPLVAIFFFFAEKKPSEEYKKHINYGILLFVLYIIITSVLRALFLGGLTFFILIIYIIISMILGYRAYNGEKVKLEILDELSDKLKNK